MLVAQRINDHITQKRGSPICDICIVEGVRLTRQAHAAQVTAALGTTADFTREDGTCSVCKNDRKVIRANRT